MDDTAVAAAQRGSVVRSASYTTLSVTIGEVQHVSSMLGIQASGGTTLFVAALIDAPGKASLSARTEPVPAADTATWNARLEFRVDAAMLEAGTLLLTLMERRAPKDEAERGASVGAAVRRVAGVVPIALSSLQAGRMERWVHMNSFLKTAPLLGAAGGECRMSLVVATYSSEMQTASRLPGGTLNTATNNTAGSAAASVLPRSPSVRRLDTHYRQLPAKPASDVAEAPPVRPAPSPMLGLTQDPAPVSSSSGMRRSDSADLNRRPSGASLGSSMGGGAMAPMLPGGPWGIGPGGRPMMMAALTLDQDFEAVAGDDALQASLPPRQKFLKRYKQGLCQDIADSLRIPPRVVSCFSLQRGSVIAKIGILLVPGGPSPETLFGALQAQIFSPQSPLRSAPTTRHATRIQKLDPAPSGDAALACSGRLSPMAATETGAEAPYVAADSVEDTRRAEGLGERNVSRSGSESEQQGRLPDSPLLKSSGAARQATTQGRLRSPAEDGTRAGDGSRASAGTPPSLSSSLRESSGLPMPAGGGSGASGPKGEPGSGASGPKGEPDSQSRELQAILTMRKEQVNSYFSHGTEVDQHTVVPIGDRLKAAAGRAQSRLRSQRSFGSGRAQQLESPDGGAPSRTSSGQSEDPPPKMSDYKLPTKDELRRLFADLDVNGDETLQRSEFVLALHRHPELSKHFIAKHQRDNPNVRMDDFRAEVAAFEKMDDDGSDEITFDEFAAFFAHGGMDEEPAKQPSAQADHHGQGHPKPAVADAPPLVVGDIAVLDGLSSQRSMGAEIGPGPIDYHESAPHTLSVPADAAGGFMVGGAPDTPRGRLRGLQAALSIAHAQADGVLPSAPQPPRATPRSAATLPAGGTWEGRGGAWRVQQRGGEAGSRATVATPGTCAADVRLVIVGPVANAGVFGEVELEEEMVVAVRTDGKIALAAARASREAQQLLAWLQDQESVEVLVLERGQVLIAGMVDTHIHAPQYSYAGTATDRPLIEWLNEVTFPAERRFEDLQHARQVYSAVVDRTLRGGTTCAMYFATLHVPASKLLANIALERGQRAFVGKVCMDRMTPAGLAESTEDALAGTEHFIRYVRGLHSDLIHPVITPRFIPSCTPALLTGLGRLAREYQCHVQSHISESPDELALVARLHPGEGTDAEIFDRHALLTDRAVFAHGVHLSDTDCTLLAARGSSLSHCPHSNFTFAGGTLRTARVVRSGVAVGLGSDVAGGCSACLFDAQRYAVVADKVLQQQQRPAGSEASKGASMDWRHALHLATQGGAAALGLEHRIGTIEAGKAFDAVLLDAAGGGIDLFPEDSTLALLEKLCNLGTEHNVAAVWIQGRRVHSRDPQRPPTAPIPLTHLSAVNVDPAPPASKDGNSSVSSSTHGGSAVKGAGNDVGGNDVGEPGAGDSRAAVRTGPMPKMSALVDQVVPGLGSRSGTQVTVYNRSGSLMRVIDSGSHPRRRPSDADIAPYTPGASGAAPLQVAEGSPMAVGDALFLQRWNSNNNSETLKAAEASQQQVVGEESEEESEEEETGSEEESESESEEEEEYDSDHDHPDAC